MIIANEGNIYLTRDIWVKLINARTSWENIFLDAIVGCSLSILKLIKWYNYEEIKLMFKVYEENMGLVKLLLEKVGKEKINEDIDYLKIYNMAMELNPEYSYF